MLAALPRNNMKSACDDFVKQQDISLVKKLRVIKGSRSKCKACDLKVVPKRCMKKGLGVSPS